MSAAPDFVAVTEGVDARDKPSTPQEQLERAVVATLYKLPREAAAAHLSDVAPEDITAPKYAFVVRAVGALHERGDAITRTALAAELEQQGAPASYRADDFLDDLDAGAETEEALAGHVVRLKEAAAKRRAGTRLHAVTSSLARNESAATVAEKLALVAQDAQLDARWPDPVSLEAPAVPPWPSGVFRGALARFVASLSLSMQVPADLPALMSFGAVSAAVAGRVAVRVGGGWSEPVNLYTAVAMPPASKKSPVVRAVTWPLLDWERREGERLAADIAESASVLRTAEKAREKAENAAAGAKDDEAREKAIAWRKRAAQDVLEAYRGLVRAPRLFTDDATPEALTSLLAEHGGVFSLLSAEGGVFDMMAGKYSAAPNLDVYLKAHSGDSIRVDRKGRAAEYVERPALTVAIATQPDTLRVLASRPELRGRGLPARFLYSVPPSNIGFRDTEAPPLDPEAVAGWRELVGALLAVPHDRDDEGRARPHLLRFDEHAARLFARFKRHVEGQLAPGQPLAELPDWGGKLVGATLRLAGLLYASEHAGADDWGAPLDHETMERAAGLALDYFVPHAHVAFQTMSDTPGLMNARKLLAWLQKRKLAVFSVRDALRALNSKGTRKDVVDPAVDVLLAHGWIREVPVEEGKKGRPSERFTVHPQALRRRP